MDSGRQAWRVAVVPAKGRAKVPAPARATPPPTAHPHGGVDQGPLGRWGPSAPDAPRGAIDPRERAIQAMVDWCHVGDRSLWLMEGGPNTGKSKLATDVAERLVAEKWDCGWARPGLAADAVIAAANAGRPSLVLVDDAETRADMGDLLQVIAQAGRLLTVRVIIIARDFGPWWTELVDRFDEAGQQMLAGGRTVIGSHGVSGAPRNAVARRAVTGEDGRQVAAVTTLTRADPVSAAVLLRLAALIVALPTRVGQLGPAEIRAAIRDLFNDEEGYWRRVSNEVTAPGNLTPSLRAALTGAAVMGADGLGDAATALRRVPALAAGAADRLARLAVWWHGLYLHGTDQTPRTPRLPTWLSDQLPNGEDASGVSWTVAALDAERRVTDTLGRLARNLHRDIWPGSAPKATEQDDAWDLMHRGIRASAPVDEALAWLTTELELDPEDLETLAGSISYPTRSLGRTAVVLARRRLDRAQAPPDKALLTTELSARLSELGRWTDACAVAEKAIETYQPLLHEDRDRHLPDYAGTVLNYGSALAQMGELEEALDVTYEAVALHRELLERDRDRHLPNLARSLTNLSACLARAGRHPAALGAAGQAVAIYRELVDLHPDAYRQELAAADHNWRVFREALGQPVAGRPPT